MVACHVPELTVPSPVSDDPVTPDASVAPVSPLAGALVAAIVPRPLAANDAPVPTTIAAALLVPLVSEENAEEPPPPPVPLRTT
jgi:hypothetical protein